MNYKDQIIQDIVIAEMSNLPDEILQNKYSIDLKKWYSEGSTWIVYNYDKMSEYYLRNKRRINNIVKHIIRREAKEL